MPSLPFLSKPLRAGASLVLALGLALGTAGCQLTPPASLRAESHQAGSVAFQLNVPRKSSKAVRQVLATGTESSTLLVNKVEVSLNGPGFFEPLYPPGTAPEKGAMDVQSGSISSRIDNVPTGKNRFIKVVAKNGDQKLNQVGGVIDVQPGPYNHAVIGLSTTPTAEIIEKLAIAAPESMPNLPAKDLQNWLDTCVTKPVTNDPAQQNVFGGVHPYLVNAQAIADHLVATGMTVPTDFDPTRDLDKTFVLQPGQVRVKTDGLPAGSRLWLNDPTSPILVTTDPTTTDYVIDHVAPNFERTADDALPPAWTLTVLTNDGRVTTMDVAIARQTLADAPMAEIAIDLRSKLADVSAQVDHIFLSPGTQTWTGTSLTLNGRVAQQLYVYAQNGAGDVYALLPNALDWQSLDARVQVGNGTPLDGTTLSPALTAADPNLGGLSLEDYGLVYPLAETSATDPADLALVKGTLKGTTKSATMGFHIGYLGSDTGRVQIDVQADGMIIKEGDQTLVDPLKPLPLTVAEPQAGPTTTYRWVSDNPLIHIEPSGSTATVSALGALPTNAKATVTVYSATGRVTSIRVGTALGNGTITGSLAAPTATFKFDTLPTRNPGNADVTANTGYPLGGYLNLYAAQATVGATDPALPAGGAFFWRSSDPFTMSVSGTFPSQRATLTAYRSGTITLTATDADGRSYTTQVRANFDRTGAVSGALQAPVNGIDLVGATTATIAADLNAVLATGTYQASERNVTTPTFRWISLDPYRLEIDPPAGQSFPNAQATFKALRPGTASFQLISSATGQTKTFSINLAFANGAATGAVQADSLLVRQLSPLPPAGSTATTVINRNPGEAVTLEATDPGDASATFVWMAETPDVVLLTSQAGSQATARIVTYGTGSVRVVNTKNGRWGRLNFNVQTTGKGTGNITVTL